jgi:glycosyltransferase involved in cell wall biosynthesis
VYHTFDWLEPGLHSRFHLLLEKYTCRHAALAVNTDRTRARLQQTLYRLPRCPLFLPNYLSKAAALPSDIARPRREMLQGLGPANPVVLVYPTIANQERLTLELLQAFKLLPRDYALVTIAMDDAYGREVRRMAASGELEGRVKVYSPMSHDQVVNLIAASDIGAIFHDVTSSSGNFMGNPSRLALLVACGIPFVAVATPNVEALVYKYALGLCCDPANPRELADSIQRLVNDPPGLSARKQHLRQVFVEELHFEKHAGRLVAELRVIVANRAAG